MSKSRLVVLLMALCSAALPKPKILVYDFEARGADSSFVAALRRELCYELRHSGGYFVLEHVPGTRCFDPIAASDSAAEHAADGALVGNVVTVQKDMHVDFQLVDATQAKVVLADRLMLTSDSQGDPVAVAARRVATLTRGRVPILRAPTLLDQVNISASTGFYSLFSKTSTLGTSADTSRGPLWCVNIDVARLGRDYAEDRTVFRYTLMREGHREIDHRIGMLDRRCLVKGVVYFEYGISYTRYSWSDTLGQWLTNSGVSLEIGQFTRVRVVKAVDITMRVGIGLVYSPSDPFGVAINTIALDGGGAFGVSTPIGFGFAGNKAVVFGAVLAAFAGGVLWRLAS